jgi:type I restriction enzyme S subunit
MTLVEARPKAAGGDAACMDGPWELPEGWVWARIGDIASLRGEKADPKQEGALPFVGMDDIEPNGLSILRTRPFAELKSSGNRFHAGDVLYGRLRPYLNKTAVASQSGACSGELLAIKPAPFLEPRFLQLFLHTRRFVNTAMSIVSGDRPRIDFGTIAEFNFPLAPLAEQRRIVARIDELFAEIAEGEAALREARKGLDLFRRALLKAAVTGELTKDWRDANGRTETGHEFLAGIRAERERNALGGRRSRRASNVASSDNSGSQCFPETWAWTNLGELFDISTGSTPSRSDPNLWDGDIPWVSSGEVAFCRIRSTRERISLAGLGNSTTRLHPPGTVLLAMIGEGKTRGQCAILDIAAANNQNAAAIRVSATPIPPEFVYHVLEERYLRSRRESQGGNQPALNAGKVAEMTIALPPLAEIGEILRRLSEAFSSASDTAAALDAEAADAARLRQSVLKAAFEGHLAPQDPADEPATAVLARPKTASSASCSRRGRPRAER